jgi:hypothetical protein
MDGVCRGLRRLCRIPPVQVWEAQILILKCGCKTRRLQNRRLRGGGEILKPKHGYDLSHHSYSSITPLSLLLLLLQEEEGGFSLFRRKQFPIHTETRLKYDPVF